MDADRAMSDTDALAGALDARQIDAPADATHAELVELLAQNLATDAEVPSMPGPSSLLPYEDRVAMAVETAIAHPVEN